MPTKKITRTRTKAVEPEADKDTVKYASNDNLLADLYMGKAEKTVRESSYDDGSMLRPYNPDDLYQKAGNYDLYDDMMHDDEISVLMKVKKDLVLTGWEIQVDDEENKEVRDDIEKLLRQEMDLPLDDALEQVLSSYEYGFSIGEKLFKVTNDNQLALRNIKVRYPNTWLIHTDVHGNVERYEQQGTDKDLMSVNPKSLLHYINDRRFQTPYGTSDLRAAYAAWFAKRQVIRFYSIFLEWAAGPKPIGRYESSASDKAIDDLYTALKKFQAKTALVIPKKLEVEFLEAKSNGEAYHKALAIFNMFIGRALFMPDLMGFQGEQTQGGSYSLGEHQLNILYRHINRRRNTLEWYVNKEIIRPIVLHNYGEMDFMPRWQLTPIKEDDVLKFSQVWAEVAKSKLWKPSEDEVNHFRESVKFPTGEVAEAPQPPPPAPFDAPDPNASETNPVTTPPPGVPDGAGPKTEEQEGPEKKTLIAAFKPPPGDYHKKVDFKRVQRNMDGTTDNVLAESKPIVDMIFEDLFDQIRKKKILEKGDISRMENVKLIKLKDLNLVLKKNLRDQYTKAQIMAKDELFNKQTFATPLPHDDFLKVLDGETFEYVGDWEYNITKGARQELVKAIKDGRPLSSVIDFYEEEGKKASNVSLERYARTKSTEVLNKGRLAFFEETGIVAAYQYSAILDAVTTVVCQGLHGKIFKAGTEPIPPLHFNCRSMLIPITQFEDFKVDTKVGSKSTDDFVEQNKGKGFPAK